MFKFSSSFISILSISLSAKYKKHKCKDTKQKFLDCYLRKITDIFVKIHLISIVYLFHE